MFSNFIADFSKSGTVPLTGERGEKVENGHAHRHDVLMEEASQEPMDASNQCCPNTMCCARGQMGQGTMRIHDRKRQR